MKRVHDLLLTQVNNYLASYIEYLNVKIKNNEMKKILYICVMGLGLLMGSCSDFLDRQPLSDSSVETFWKSEQDFKAWNAGMYDGLQATLRTNWFDWGEVRDGAYTARGTAYDTNLLWNALTSGSGDLQLEQPVCNYFPGKCRNQEYPVVRSRNNSDESLSCTSIHHACLDVFLCH